MTTTIDERSEAVADTPTASTIRRDRAGLLAALDAVDSEGWDGPTGCALLGYVRATVVRPQVAAVGLRGPAAEQAEATGWAVAWELLAGHSLRTARPATTSLSDGLCTGGANESRVCGLTVGPERSPHVPRDRRADVAAGG